VVEASDSHEMIVGQHDLPTHQRATLKIKIMPGI
jgi:hypothetical protein